MAIDLRLRRGVLYFPKPTRGRRPRWAPAFPLDELLFQHRLAQQGAAEVHAFGVVQEPGAVLFCGHSGAGKSTLSRLWNRARPKDRILSDDRVVLTRRGRDLITHGTPWHGDAAMAAAAERRLAALFFLKQSGENRAVPLAPTDTAARLFSRMFPPLWDAGAVTRVLELCDRASSVPSFELRFRPEGDAVRVARAALAE